MTSERLLLGAALVAAAGCGDFERGDGVATEDLGGADENGDGEVSPTFADSVHPLLMSRCAGCHTAGGIAGTTGYVLSGDVDEDRARASGFVSPGNPSGSRLLNKASGEGHGGGAVLPAGSADHATLRDWIAAGAAP